MKKTGTIKLETKRLILRRFTLDDAADMYKNWVNDHEVCRFLTWPPHESIDITRSVLQSWIEQYADTGYDQWCMELKETGEAVGSIGVVNTREEIEAVEIGYCMSKNYWRRGLMSEALSALIEFFFQTVELNRIEAYHDVQNPNSGKVMKKCGMKYEGTKIMGAKNNTGICDISIYGIINPGIVSSIE